MSLVGAAAGGLVVGVAKFTGASLDLSVEGLLPIVVLGVGTDYVVFLLFRYRERLRAGEERREAMARAVAWVGAAVTSSAFAVVVSFSALLLSAFEGFRVLGPALTFQLPLIVYLFVASMGGDYNILMVARVREEIAEGATPREAAARAVRRSWPAVGAAGIVLAASFAALLLDTSLAQIGFAVALGIFLSAFVMAGLLVPALTALLGRRAFWPARAGVPAAGAVPARGTRGEIAAQE